MIIWPISSGLAGVPSPPDPPPDPGLVLTPSGAVSFNANGQVIEGLDITSSSGNAVASGGFDDCVLRNCRIRHQGGRGLNVHEGSLRFKARNLDVKHSGAPATGPHVGGSVNDNCNIEIGSGSHDCEVTNVRVRNGASGIYVVDSDRAVLSNIEGAGFRGPFPRGQIAQFNKSDDCTLQDFSVIIDRDVDWPEDVFNSHQSANTIVRRGLVDGCNAKSGVGVMAEVGLGAGGSNALFEDIDVIRQGNGSFANIDMKAGSGIFGATYRRCRARDMDNREYQNRGLPRSTNNNTTSGLHFRSTAENGGAGTFIEKCVYWYVPSENEGKPLNLTWMNSTLTYATNRATDLVLSDFTPRAKITLVFPWE